MVQVKVECHIWARRSNRKNLTAKLKLSQPLSRKPKTTKRSSRRLPQKIVPLPLRPTYLPIYHPCTYPRTSPVRNHLRRYSLSPSHDLFSQSFFHTPFFRLVSFSATRSLAYLCSRTLILTVRCSWLIFLTHLLTILSSRTLDDFAFSLFVPLFSTSLHSIRDCIPLFTSSGDLLVARRCPTKGRDWPQRRKVVRSVFLRRDRTTSISQTSGSTPSPLSST